MDRIEEVIKASNEMLSFENQEIKTVCLDHGRCAYGYMQKLIMEHEDAGNEFRALNDDPVSDTFIQYKAHELARQYYIILTNPW